MSQIIREDFSLVDPHEWDDVLVPEEEILEVFKRCNALWSHDGDPAKPHAELTSDRCSDGFFDCMRVLCHPVLCEIMAKQLVYRLRDSGLAHVDWVVGSPYAAITFSYEVAKLLGARHGFCEKDYTDPAAKKFKWARLGIPASASVLQIEELITTKGTLIEVERAITEGNPEPVTFLAVKGTLVLRPSRLSSEHNDIVAVVRKEIQEWDPRVCPLCKVGSKRLKPKYNWEELARK